MTAAAHFHRFEHQNCSRLCRPGQENAEDTCHSFCPSGILLSLTWNRKRGLPLNFCLSMVQFREQAVCEFKSGPTEVKKMDDPVPDGSFLQCSYLCPVFLLPSYFSDAPVSCSIRSVQGFSRVSLFSPP